MDGQFDVMVPVRVDLSGGWTDVDPYCTDFGGEVINFTINKYVKARVDKSKEITYDFDIPMGSGCLLYTSPSPRDLSTSRMPSSA